MPLFYRGKDLKIQILLLCCAENTFSVEWEGGRDPNIIRNFCFSVFFSRCIWLISSDFQRSAEIILVLTLLVSNVVSWSGSNSVQVHKDSNQCPRDLCLSKCSEFIAVTHSRKSCYSRWT